MILRREQLEGLEYEILAPYAMKAAESRGRRYAQEESPVRTCFQRDYDRIIHSKSFRRMEYKTQVFVNSVGDHYRTRLTHSMEVAQICRGISRTLGLNENLSEAVALAHDLGHPPFGHAGERALDDILATAGGFNHNTQSLRVIDMLESRYPTHPGLNLSYEVREGIAKHRSPGAVFDREEFPLSEAPTLEAAIVDIADEIAYNSHDLDDGLAMRLFTLEELRDLTMWRRALEMSEAKYPNLTSDMRRYDLIRRLVSRQVEDLAQVVGTIIRDERIDSLATIRARSSPIADFSSQLREEIAQLRSFLTDRMYRHSLVLEMSETGAEIVRELFAYFMDYPEQMPAGFSARIDTDPLERIVCDYVAGMTDRFAESMVTGIRRGTQFTTAPDDPNL